MIVMIAVLNDGAILSIAMQCSLQRQAREGNMRLCRISDGAGLIGVVAAFASSILPSAYFISTARTPKR